MDHEPELLLGFRRVGDEIIIIAPDGSSRAFQHDEFFEEVQRRIATDGQPQVVSGKLDVTEEQLRSAYGVLYDFVKAHASARVGGEVVEAGERVLKHAHRKAEKALANAPRGPSRKLELRRRAKEAWEAKQRGGG